MLKFLLIFALVNSVAAHSWLDILSPDFNVAQANGLKNDWVFSAKNTKGVGAYARNYETRDSPKTNEINTRQLQDSTLKNPNTEICGGQTRGSYAGFGGPDWRHMLKAKPGDKIYFGYTENGHLSKSFEGVGTNIVIYWLSNGNEIKKVGDLTQVVAEINFDDGRMCGESTNRQGQKNGRTGKPCVGSFTVPNPPKSGIYSFVWFWDEKIPAYYHNCFDIEITAGGNTNTQNNVKCLRAI
jgi:hypothetical protein